MGMKVSAQATFDMLNRESPKVVRLHIFLAAALACQVALSADPAEIVDRRTVAEEVKYYVHFTDCECRQLLLRSACCAPKGRVYHRGSCRSPRACQVDFRLVLPSSCALQSTSGWTSGSRRQE